MSTATAAAVVDQRVALTFASKGNSRTKWMEITYPTDAVPQAMLDDLASIGFAPQDGMAVLPPVPASHYDETKPVGERFIDLGYKEQTVHLSKRGTDLFTGWTEQEERANMRAARAVLRRYGFVRVPVWRKTLADML